jgi:hypothetical protein
MVVYCRKSNNNYSYWLCWWIDAVAIYTYSNNTGEFVLILSDYR